MELKAELFCSTGATNRNRLTDLFSGKFHQLKTAGARTGISAEGLTKMTPPGACSAGRRCRIYNDLQMVARACHKANGFNERTGSNPGSEDLVP